MKKLHCPMCSGAVDEVGGGKYRCPACGFRFAAVEEAELPAAAAAARAAALEEGISIKSYEAWEKAVGSFELARIFFDGGGEVVLSKDGMDVLRFEAGKAAKGSMLARSVLRVAEDACSRKLQARRAETEAVRP